MDYGAIIAAGVAVIATSAAVWGLFYQGKSIREATKVAELQFFEGIFKDIRALEKDLYEIGVNFSGKEFDERREKWRDLFLQTLEYFCFLANRKYISDSTLINYFRPAVFEWYKSVFLYLPKKGELEDPGTYPELKKFCGKT